MRTWLVSLATLRATASYLAAAALLTGAVHLSTLDALASATPDTPAPTPTPPLCESAPGGVYIDAGTVTNTTTLDLSADGGTGIGDSSGGDDNLATTGGEDKDHDKKGDNKNNNNKKNQRDRDDDNDGEISAAGNGGLSDAGADGGAIAVENVNSGGNVGSAIAVGDTVAGPVPVPVCCPAPPKPVPGKPSAPIYTPPGKVVVVTRLPSTGAGTPLAGSASLAALLALATGAASLASRRRPPMI